MNTRKVVLDGSQNMPGNELLGGGLSSLIAFLLLSLLEIISICHGNDRL